ncbi:MFS transporter [Actinomycetospora cinnamomea]|uniref:Putative MFS family arabinose efflux permease n=1 Tax=Actinomycetospora cinnamomea TaxID=663609 RepID=A0A2U1FHV1_9PSEU|nr:MFS transporter [Actinomycetospora cinnamomea]PVZ11763.1 putative MFS family arabinose efflux permease [Actinomycetospora cinnamomea]
MRSAEARLAVAGAAVVGVAFGMGRFAFGLTLPALRMDPALSAGGLGDTILGLIASGTFAGYLAGILLAPVLARRFGPRAPTTVGSVCGALGGTVVAVAPSAGVLAAGAVLTGSAAGWVWAPYSDLARVVADPSRRPRTLAVINTGTSVGLLVVGAVGLVATGGAGWRVVWAAIGFASAAAGLLNLWWSPRAERTSPRGGRAAPRGTVWRLAVPSVYSVAYYVGTTTFFTWAADTLRRAGLPSSAGPVLYVVVGLTGLVALATGGWSARFGTPRVAAACLGAVAVALAALGLGGGSWPVALVAAVVFGPGYMSGAAVIAVWTTELVPERPGEAMTAVVAVGAVSAVIAPTVVGLLLGAVGLPVVLVGLGVLLVATAGGVLAARNGRRARPG